MSGMPDIPKLTSIEVLVDSLKPSYIIVRVRDKMDIQHGGGSGRTTL